MKIHDSGVFTINFSALSYNTGKSTIIIDSLKPPKEITLDYVLNYKNLILSEVIIHDSKPIIIKKDTIIYKVKNFIKGNEQVVEDLLKNIPGINIDSDGTIKAGNKEIEKLMIDGDDFFEKGYKILSKNMPPDQIENIELLQRFSNNKLLTGVEKSDKVALNLVLKEDAKRNWFGNINLGYDITFKNRYNFQSNLMNFGKKNKYYFLTNFNNIGYDATGDINHLIRPIRYGEPSSIGDNENANSLLSLNSATPNFKASRTNFNSEKLVSLNAIFTLSKKVKLKTLGLFNWDINDFYRNQAQVYGTSENGFTNTEDYQLRKKKYIGFGKVDLTYDISKTKMLEVTSKYNNQETNSVSNLIFNEEETNERLKTLNELFDQKITFTNRIKKNKVYLLTGRYIYEKTPQDYNINQFFYQNLFPDITNTNNVSQLSENQMQFVGFESHLLDRKENGNLLELQLGNQFRKDKLLSSFFLKEDSAIIETPNDYQNNTIYISNDLYFNTKYRIKVKNLAFTGKLDFHQLINQLEQNNITKQQPFFINPRISFDWEINKKNKILGSYAYNITNSKILDVYRNYVLSDYWSFEKGTGNFNQLNASTLFFNYQLGNWSDIFFANAFIIYNKNHNFFSTNTFITQNYSQSKKIIINDREMFNISSNMDRYFKSISSNLKLNLGYTKTNYKNIINDSDFREIKSTNYSYGVELRSGFTGVFNYHIGTKWKTNQIETTIVDAYTNNTSFLDLSYVFTDKLSVYLQAERYYFGNVDKNNNTYYFADLQARYKFKDNKLTFSLSGKNLFNTERFKIYTIDDISSTTTEYRLLPRNILLKMEYRF
ncbi:MAG: TonB-dependent receptor [Bacteroidota bacterium]